MKRYLRPLKRFLLDTQQAFFVNANLHRRQRLLATYRSCKTVRETMAFTRDHLDTGICQLACEIEGALDVLVPEHPRTICEIGTATGGNLLLLSRWLPDAELVLGIDLWVRNKAYLKLLRQPSQRIVLLDGSSYARKTAEKVGRILGHRRLDVLFIDGDHRYEGVKEDFLRYRHFVAEGGHILFHDIVSDKGDGWRWSGGVPIFWSEIKDLYPSKEFVENPQQRGLGIGLVRYSSGIVLPKGFEAVD